MYGERRIAILSVDVLHYEIGRNKKINEIGRNNSVSPQILLNLEFPGVTTHGYLTYIKYLEKYCLPVQLPLLQVVFETCI